MGPTSMVEGGERGERKKKWGKEEGKGLTWRDNYTPSIAYAPDITSAAILTVCLAMSNGELRRGAHLPYLSP